MATKKKEACAIEDAPQKEAKAEPTIDEKKVLFVCDRRKCERCDSGCRHTNDISHAAHFELSDGYFVEK